MHDGIENAGIVHVDVIYLFFEHSSPHSFVSFDWKYETRSNNQSCGSEARTIDNVVSHSHSSPFQVTGDNSMNGTRTETKFMWDAFLLGFFLVRRNSATK